LTLKIANITIAALRIKFHEESTMPRLGHEAKIHPRQLNHRQPDNKADKTNQAKQSNPDKSDQSNYAEIHTEIHNIL